jgi:hypothetical protein
MAPPIPGLRPPANASRQRRTTGDVGLGIAAIVALIALTVGVPFALTTFLGLPIPHSRPSVSLLTGEISLQTILRFLSIIVWLAWAQLVWCVIVEIRGAVRNVGVPTRVPFSGGTQTLANRLVTAALLLFSAAAALSPALTTSSAAAPQPAYSVSAQAQFPSQVQTAATAAATPQTPAPQTQTQTAQAVQAVSKIYSVQPPEGRYHESLWEIAQNHLGDGRRYKEIFELNKDTIQPDGSRLTIASLIRPGWVLKMPGDATGPGIQTVAAQQATQPATPAQQGAAQQGPDSLSASVTNGRYFEVQQNQTAQNERSVVNAWSAELSAASLLAAGVLSALGRRRRERLWQRAFGRRLVAPVGDAAAVEAALRLGADDPAVALLDTSLRHLSAALAAQGTAPPTVFAAHLSDSKLDLWIAPPDPRPPAPWLAADGGQVWRLPAAEAMALDGGGALAPYPGLVTLGMNESGRVMVDLEAAHGLIALRGPDEKVRAALAALAVELVTNRWSDRMRVTLVGFGSGLELIAPDRVTVASSLDEALPELERRSADLEGQLTAWGLDSVLNGRSVTANVDAWTPHYLITATPPTPEQAQRLLTIARSRYRTGIGLLVAGSLDGASWDWELNADGRLHAGVLGFDVRAQSLSSAQYSAVVSLFHDGDGDAPLSPFRAASPARLRSGAASVSVGVLGAPVVRVPGSFSPSPERAGLMTELVMYLAAHPDGVHPNVLTGALWPRGVTHEVRDAVLDRTRQWLGADHLGQPNLVTGPDGRLRLGPDVEVDWQVFRGLVGSAVAQRSADPAAAATLGHALGLVRGQLLDGRDAGRYTWLTTSDFCYEVTALVADTAHSLSALLLSQRDAAGAMDAARSGLRLAFDDELLWRDLLRGAAATGQEAVLRAAVDEVSARMALDEVMARMAPETEALIDELLPSWRSPAA